MDISLVVPVRDEARSISRLLASIAVQTRQPDEVLFVDAGSADGTLHTIGSFKDRKFTLKTFPIGPAYPGIARNAGVKEARYDVIAFTDGGIELDREWLKELSQVMENDPSVDVVYGSYLPRTDTLFKESLAITIVPPAEKRSSFIASSLLKKAVWQGAGGFPDFRAAEDRIFMDRIKERGFKIRYNSKAVVIWDIPSNVIKVFSRFYNYSFHDLKAGVAKNWHIPVAKMYLAVSILLILGIVFSPLFFIIPAAGFLARIAKKIFINRREPYFRRMMTPCYFFLTGILILVIDLAMFAGSARYAAEGLKR